MLFKGENMKQKLSNFLVSAGYFYIATSLPEFSAFFIPTNSSVELITVIDYQKEIYLTEEIYKSICENFKKSFYEKGFKNVHMLTLVLYKENVYSSPVFDSEPFSWYINTTDSSLYIPDKHIEDFYGLKEKIENFFLNQEHYEQLEEVFESLEENGQKVKKKWRELPYINGSIVFINVLLFILCAFWPDMLYNKGAFSIVSIIEQKQYYRFITSAFLHADVEHLFSNMVVLFFLGNILEEKLGHFRYLFLYFVSMIAGNVVSTIYEMYIGEYVISVGASGAIFGVVGAVLMLVVLKGGKWENISLPRILLMVTYALYSGFVSENVNNAAHIGGFITGMVIVFLHYIIRKFITKKEASYEN